MEIRILVQAVCFTAAVASLSACGTTSVPAPTPPDVYAVGADTNGNLFKAVVWKNNVATELDSGNYGARAYAIAVANGHVYVAGAEGSSSGNNVAVMWTDGAPTLLTNGGSANAIVVSGTDVYVAGYESIFNVTYGVYVDHPAYWKNGMPITLTNAAGSATGTAAAIAVDGSDIYVAGNVETKTETAPNDYLTTNVVTYWKNGVATAITDGLEAAESFGITAQNGHVYISGTLCSNTTLYCYATLWTDGVAASLTPNLVSSAGSLALSGSSIYTPVNVTDLPSNILATTGSTAELSTNGSLTPLSTSDQSAANCVTVYGTDVYVGGQESDTSAYWLNGKLTYLTGVPTGAGVLATVYAMVVVPSS